MTFSMISSPNKHNRLVRHFPAALMALALASLSIRAGYCADTDLARSTELPASEMQADQGTDLIVGARPSANGAQIVQLGNKNDVSITQNSDTNLAQILQAGNLNQAVMQQSAGAPPAKINQYGSGTFAKLIQY